MQHVLSESDPLWELPLRLKPGAPLAGLFTAPDAATAVIPVKDDTGGLRETLAALRVLDIGACPAEVIVVDDGSADHGEGTTAVVAEAKLRGQPVLLVVLPANRGPAAARNTGAKLAATGWIWFVDAGVRPAPEFLDVAVRAGSSLPAVAWTGPTLPDPTGLLADYYAAQGILSPPSSPVDRSLESFITASVLVRREAFESVGGFDEDFRQAGGEDLDLGLRLRPHGTIGWSPGLCSCHRFREDEDDFRRRFRRYGAGLQQFGRKWGVGMQPWPVVARRDSPEHRRLALIQHEELWVGWRRAAGEPIEATAAADR